MGVFTLYICTYIYVYIYVCVYKYKYMPALGNRSVICWARERERERESAREKVEETERQ